MTHRVAVIAGDGAGREVIAEARKAVDALRLDLEWNELPWGTDYFHEHGAMMPPDGEVAGAHDSILLGAVGHPSVADHITLWGLLLPLRQGLDLYANLRPARLLDGVPSALESLLRAPADTRVLALGVLAHEEHVDLPDEVRQDPIFHRMKGERKGRDGCRVPLPWENGAPGFGFTSGTPWLPIPAEWSGRTAAVQQADEHSVLALYRDALARRPSGDFAWRDSPAGTLVFRRGAVTCAVNVDGEPLPLEGEVVLASEGVTTELPPGAAAWLR